LDDPHALDRADQEPDHRPGARAGRGLRPDHELLRPVARGPPPRLRRRPRLPDPAQRLLPVRPAGPHALPWGCAAGDPVTYAVKEIYYTLQGEGVNTGRPAVFLRFAGCNLWTGREEDRASATCRFCDTDFA